MHKQVSPEQVDIWLQDPVTLAVLDSINYLLESAKKTLANSTGVDPSNAHLTLHNQGKLGGVRDTLMEISDIPSFLGKYERPEVANG